MAKPIHNTIKQALHTAEGLYHRLVLLVGPSGTGKTAALQAIAKEYDTAIINVNLTLAKGLLELTEKRRALRVPEILDRLARQTGPLVILDNLEILFDMSLQQDPLRLLQGVSRNQTVVASWNGTMHANQLLYAEIGHPEYRTYEHADAVMVPMHDSPITTSDNNNQQAERV